MSWQSKTTLHSGEIKESIYTIRELRDIMKASPMYKKRKVQPVEPWIIEECINNNKNIMRIDIKRQTHYGLKR